jgi:hypothetical protein
MPLNSSSSWSIREEEKRGEETKGPWNTSREKGLSGLKLKGEKTGDNERPRD